MKELLMSMDCKEIEKLIPRFVKDECAKEEEQILLEHIRKCPACKEELTIQFLLEEGLNRLEAGESFDLNKELEKRLVSRKEENKPRKKFLTPEQSVVVVDIIGGALLVALIIGLLIGYIHL
jgi:Zn ribbon nucleic-acid-binding protein